MIIPITLIETVAIIGVIPWDMSRVTLAQKGKKKACIH